jgi:hypothetical protein
MNDDIHLNNEAPSKFSFDSLNGKITNNEFGIKFDYMDQDSMTLILTLYVFFF